MREDGGDLGEVLVAGITANRSNMESILLLRVVWASEREAWF